MGTLRVFAVAALSVELMGCSLALKVESQCNVDADCPARGAEFAGTVCKANLCVAPPDPKWSCVGNVEAEPSNQVDKVTIRLLDLISEEPVTSGLTLKLCAKIDADCTSPLNAPTVEQQEGGSISVDLSATQEAYLDVQSTTYVPSLVILDHFAWTQMNAVVLVPIAALAGVASAADTTLDPTKGLLNVLLVNCQNEPTEGATMRLGKPGSEKRFFQIDKSITDQATESDASGIGGLANVEPGVVTVEGLIASENKVYSRVSTLVRANAATYQPLRPTAGL